jgi:hypothetical protein
VYSLSSRKQKYVPASSREAVITAFSITKERHYLAVGEKVTTLSSNQNAPNGNNLQIGAAANASNMPTYMVKSMVQVYSLPTFRKRKSLNVNEVFPERQPKVRIIVL